MTSYATKLLQKLTGWTGNSDGCDGSNQRAPSRSPNGSLLWSEEMEAEHESGAAIVGARRQERQQESPNRSESEGLQLPSTARTSLNSSLRSSGSSNASSSATSQVATHDANSDPTVIREAGIGVIGVLAYGEGVIDSKYRFCISEFPNLIDVKGRFMLKLGDKVEFIAEQRDGVHFYITSMKHFVPAKEVHMKELLKSSTEIGYITKLEVSDGSVFVCCNEKENENPIRVTHDKLPGGIDLVPGDWLKLNVTYGELNETTQTAQIDVLSSDPLSVKEIDGAILERIRYPENQPRPKLHNFIQSGMVCCIDNKIIADDSLVRNAIGNKYEAIVKVTAIESKQGIYKYRAIRLAKVDKHLAYNVRRQNMQRDHILTPEQHEVYKNLYKNKQGIVIEPKHYIDFGEVVLHGWKEKSFTIKNTTSTDPCILKAVTLNYEQSVAKFELQLLKAEAEDFLTIIEPGQILTIKAKVTPIEWGRTSEIITFEFEGFMIIRDLRMYGYPPEMQGEEENRNTRGRGSQDSYTRGRRNEKQRKYNENADVKKQLGNREVAFGSLAIRPPFFGGRSKFQLERYEIPALIAEAQRSQVTTALYEYFPSLKCTGEFYDTKPVTVPLTPENYSDCFQAGLWLEEIESEIRLNELSKEKVRLYRDGDYMYFNAPYYEPSQTQIQIGLSFFVFDEADPAAPKHRSSIVKIESGCIYGLFSIEMMNEYKDQPMSVHYETARTTFRRWHFAATHAMEMLGSNWLFPQRLEVRAPRVKLIESKDDDDEEEEELTIEERDKDEGRSEEGKAPESEAEKSLNVTTESPKKEEKEKDTRNQVRVGAGKFKSLQMHQKHRDELNFRMTSTFQADVTRKAEAEVLEKDVRLNWFNKTLNSEQKDAVRRIMKGQCRPHPFIIYGPPGTGKTVTLVEAILQVNKLFKNSRILVTAPTNAAADLITEYLIDSGRFRVGVLTRLLGFRRCGALMSPKIELYCSDPEKLNIVARSSIVITTTNSAALLFGDAADITEDNFSHVFIDEAGCCFEPDGLLPALLVNVRGHGQLIMAGDHKQLGPHVQSNSAKFYGLGISLLQRFMETKLYATASTDGVLVTKLVKNYRSHETILKVPSQLFYGDELVPLALEDETMELLERLERNGGMCSEFSLPNPKVPLLFYGLAASEGRDANSYSWYNDAEVGAAVDLVRKLIVCGCVPADIGIITPYRRQAEKIRSAIGRQLGCDLPKIGTVEVFQGDERKIIILSLVRSSMEKDTGYMMSKLWFVFSEERTNVMLTRARCLQIVVGNPHLFCKSPVWRTYIEHCLSLGAYDPRSCPLPTYLNPKFLELLEQCNRKVAREPSALQSAVLQSNNQNPYLVPLYEEPEW